MLDLLRTMDVSIVAKGSLEEELQGVLGILEQG